MPVSLMREHTVFVSKIVEDWLVGGGLSNISLCTEILEMFSSLCLPLVRLLCVCVISRSRLNILALAQDPRNSYSRFSSCIQWALCSSVLICTCSPFLLPCHMFSVALTFSKWTWRIVMVDCRIDGCQATWYVRLCSISYFSRSQLPLLSLYLSAC